MKNVRKGHLLGSLFTTCVRRLQDPASTSDEKAQLYPVIPCFTSLAGTGEVAQSVAFLLQSDTFLSSVAGQSKDEKMVKAAKDFTKLIGIGGSCESTAGCIIRDSTDRVVKVINTFCPHSDTVLDHLCRAIGGLHKCKESQKYIIPIAERLFTSLRVSNNGPQLTDIMLPEVVRAVLWAVPYVEITPEKRETVRLFLQRYPGRNFNSLRRIAATEMQQSYSIDWKSPDVWFSIREYLGEVNHHSNRHLLVSTLPNYKKVMERFNETHRHAITPPILMSIMGAKRWALENNETEVLVTIHSFLVNMFNIENCEGESSWSLVRGFLAAFASRTYKPIASFERQRQAVLNMLNVSEISFKERLTYIRVLNAVSPAHGNDLLTQDEVSELFLQLFTRCPSLTDEDLTQTIVYLTDRRVQLPNSVLSSLSKNLGNVPINSLNTAVNVGIAAGIHLPAGESSGLLKFMTQHFIHLCESQREIDFSILLNFFSLVIKNEAGSKEFFVKATEFIQKLPDPKDSKDTKISVISNAAIQILPFLAVHKKVRVKEGRLFISAAIDYNNKLLTSCKTIDVPLFSRIFDVCVEIVVSNAAANTNQLLRPILQHLLRCHEVTERTISAIFRSITRNFKRTLSANEAKKMMPLLNFVCTIVIRDPGLVSPETAAFGSIIICRRGAVLSSPVNPIHKRTLRLFSSIILADSNRDSLCSFLASGNDNVIIAELLGHSHIFDVGVRKKLLALCLDPMTSPLTSERGVLTSLWSVTKGEFIWF